jgi:NAD(P)-dependent dehydrogenase (short-subunit alcohol dehydrogenase family)
MTQHSHQIAPTQFVPTAKRTALVTGASGLAGGYMLAHLLEQGGWDIVAVSRRKPRIPGDYKYIAVDLLDPADCRTKLGRLTNISHLFYLTITERLDPRETVSANSNMFFNLVKTYRGRLARARAYPPLSGHQVVRKSLGSLQDSDQGGRSAAHAAKLLLQPAGLP